MSAKRFTIEDIRSWKPCYDPATYLPEGWEGTAADLLNLKGIPAQDRLWAVLREDVLSVQALRIFATSCARSVYHLMTDDRSRFAVEFMEAYCEWRYLSDDPDWVRLWEEERAAARDAAWDTAGTAARDAAWAAAGTSAWDAAVIAQIIKLIQIIESDEFEGGE
jgi:hypothetical protein